MSPPRIATPRVSVRASRRIVLVLTVLVLLGSVLCLVLALTKPGTPARADSPRPRVDDGRYVPAALAGPAGPALRAAVDDVPLALTYDYRTLPASIAAATATMTPDFARRYTSSFRASVAPSARSGKQVTDASVSAGGVVRASGADRVRCLLYLDQRLVSSTADHGTVAPTVISRSRVLVDLVLVDGTWRVDNIAPV